MEFLRKKKKQKTNKELYNSHVSDVLFLIHVFTFSQTLLLASANKLTTKSQNHLHIMCFVYLYGKYEKIATIINLIFFVYKSWEEMLITTLQTSTKSERLLNNFHLTHDNRFRSLFCYLVNTLTFIIISVTILLIRIIMQVTSTVAFFTADIFVMS